MRPVRIPVGPGLATEAQVCDGCGGAWFAFFDGEPGALARALRGELRPLVPSPEDPGSSGTYEVLSASGICPDCGMDMTPHRYLDSGPYLARCGGCLSVFASRGQLEALADFGLLADLPTLGHRLLGALRRLVGGGGR